MKIMVVSPHPDDETLGAGGTLLKMKKRGHNIFWLNVTDVTSEMGWDENFVIHRADQIKNINDVFSFDGFYNLALSSSKLSNLDEGLIIEKIKQVFDEVKPEWIIIPGDYDAHSDHRVVYNCCMAAAKTFRSQYINRITTMEIISETDYGFQSSKFEPNLYIDISGELETKIDAMKIYDTELFAPPFPRNIESIKSLARIRGASIAVEYAEAFHIVKQIE